MIPTRGTASPTALPPLSFPDVNCNEGHHSATNFVLSLARFLYCHYSDMRYCNTTLDEANKSETSESHVYRGTYERP